MSWPPPHSTLVTEGQVLGEAATAGSKTSGVAFRKDKSGKSVPVTFRGKDGKEHIRTFTKDDSGEKGKTWRSDVRDALGALLGPDHVLLTGPLALEICFFRTGPQGRYGTGRNAGNLKDGALAFPTTKPDGTKQLRAFEDALSKIVWQDDSQIVDWRISKRFTRFGDPARAEFRLWTRPATIGELRLADHNQEQAALRV